MKPIEKSSTFSGKIFINPNFNSKNQNVQQPSTIYVNPAFLNSTNAIGIGITNRDRQPSTEIITKTRTKIIRKNASSAGVIPLIKPAATNISSNSCLVKIGNRKLIRTAIKSPSNKQKIEYISRFALSRKKSNSPKFKVRKSENLRKLSDKKMQFLTINGIMYKSTVTKLQRKSCNETKVIKTKSPIPSEETKERIIKVRGDKFVLEKNGKTLRRMNNLNVDDKQADFKRIDIGGLTYLAESTNLFVRTNLHKARTHLNQARNKSLLVLSKNRFKTNIPCPIFRSLGKCAANEKGKCMKKHDPNQVVVCSKFLRGECTNTNCFLSHNVSFSKMPVCKFFLQGLCVRDDCPYLHKKLNENAEVCIDFQRGFCQLADKCEKKHENAPTMPKTKFLSVKKNYGTSNSIRETQEDQIKESCRYFFDEECARGASGGSTELECVNDDELLEGKSLKRPKLGSLPSFIPL